MIGDIAPCKKVPGDVKWQMERLVLEGKNNRAKKRQLSEEIGNPYGTLRGDANEDDFEMDGVEIFTNPTTRTTTTRKGKEKVSNIYSKQKKGSVKYSPTSNAQFLCTTNDN